MPRYIDIVGRQNNELTVLSRAGKSKAGESLVRCLCSCGNKVIVQLSNFTSGHTKSCGHLLVKVMTKHGKENTPLYQVWEGIKQRCFNPKASGYSFYGGRGVTIAELWANDFAAFEAYILSTIGPRPDVKTEKSNAEYTIDRWPNRSGNYEPGNIRWATKKEQSQSSKKSHCKYGHPRIPETVKNRACMTCYRLKHAPRVQVAA